MIAPTHSRPWHKQKVSSVVDATLFFLVFGGGVAGIFWLKQRDIDPLTVIALPCVLLLLYAAVVGFVPRFRLRADQAGDNCYYLGFLFTLFSLAHALTSFVRAGSTEMIVEDFGIALATTIIGLALRVAFNQMRQDPVEIEREARLELAAAAQRLRSELDQSVVEMNVFRRATQQSIADGLEELNAKVGELLEKNLARYDEVTSGAVERIDRTLAAFAENAQHLNGVAEKTAAAIEALTARIEAIKAPEDLVERKLAPAVTAGIRAALEEAGRAVAATGDELRRALVEPAGEAGVALATIARHAESLREIEAQLRRLPAVLEEQIAMLARLRKESTGARRFFDFSWRR